MILQDEPNNITRLELTESEALILIKSLTNALIGLGGRSISTYQVRSLGLVKVDIDGNQAPWCITLEVNRS